MSDKVDWLEIMRQMNAERPTGVGTSPVNPKGGIGIGAKAAEMVGRQVLGPEFGDITEWDAYSKGERNVDRLIAKARAGKPIPKANVIRETMTIPLEQIKPRSLLSKAGKVLGPLAGAAGGLVGGTALDLLLNPREASANEAEQMANWQRAQGQDVPARFPGDPLASPLPLEPLVNEPVMDENEWKRLALEALQGRY